jgi:MFS family permease
MYAVTVALPAVQAEFGVSRSDASLPYTLTMIGFALGGMLMGQLSDRFGVMVRCSPAALRSAWDSSRPETPAACGSSRSRTAC